jgi:3-oxoacyl-[acyl-carrier-protein] synthase-1
VYELGLVRTLDQPTGFFPGEAAAFLLLERIDTARRRGGRIEALLGPWSVTKAEKDRFSGVPLRGRGLSRVIQECVGSKVKPTREVALAIVNLNGDELRAKEFGMALTHLASNGIPTDFRIWMPPEHFGEIGAATGPVSVCLGTRGFVRGYAHTSALLVGLMGDDGSRGAVMLGPAMSS